MRRRKISYPPPHCFIAREFWDPEMLSLLTVLPALAGQRR
jgi:hypothetical protein